VTAPIICWYRDRGILVSVDAMRPAQQVGREILTSPGRDARPLLDSQAARAQNPGDLATLTKAFGATGPAADPSE
jgi:adenylate kinase